MDGKLGKGEDGRLPLGDLFGQEGATFGAKQGTHVLVSATFGTSNHGLCRRSKWCALPERVYRT